ncbi:Lar family restriction alleviation protein [Burkholderia glumae]|uniref:Lar family restriction alleviation protein n=1 Tax=Burkholderia glumae TaxID=337 RepID=A0ABY5BDK5_BURGL|nr:Lar family restriction alleviation protein [Burkholderia glumae]QTP33520.1 hypothetical protein B7759_02114 [Burkholderia glumae]USS45110.1 Lar family restriction alleviation protein [Burkholderia glumae]
MSDKLSDCPFCGYHAQVTEGSGAFFGRVQVECASCRIATFWLEEDVARQLWNRRALPAPAISESDGLLQLVVAWRMDICVTAGDVRATAHRQPDHRVYVVEKPGDSVESLSRAIKNAAAAIDAARKGEKP